MKRLWSLLVVVFIAVGLVISAGQDLRAAGPAMEMPKGKEFVNKSPAFSVIYPQYYEGKPLETAEVLRVVDKPGLPAFVCTVSDAPKGVALNALPQAGLEALQKDPRYATKKGWKLDSQKVTKLVDGTPAVEYEIGWDWQWLLRFHTTTLSTISNGKIVACSVTSTDAGNKKYVKYLYSLKLK